MYHSYRLHVRNRCMQVAGTVVAVRHEDDGDIHVNLRLPASETHLLDHANYMAEHGDLVTELVPADQPGCTPGRAPKPGHGSYSYGICTGADIGTPPIGSRVTVVGPYVLDADHGWMEIHPVWGFTVVGHVAPATTAAPPTTAAPAPTSPPTTAPAPSGCSPRTSGGNCYEPGEYCRSSDHGASGVAGDGQRITCVDSNGWRWEAQ
ncbi:MAG TPA: hypothetical protein VE152_12240 [Acidimicrobiales bacterium]|nr:hypothetical protein [Acidimicrobiales bacterium]